MADIRKTLIANRKGISLLEVLMVVGLMTVLATGAAQLFDDWFKKSVNRKVAAEMTDLHDAAERFVILNMERILDDYIPNENDVAEIDVDELIDRDFLPADFVSRNSFNQEMRIVIRNAGDDTVKGTAVEVLVLGDDRNNRDSRMHDTRLFDAALSGGPKLGLISAMNMGPNCCNGNIQSAYGEWSVPLSDFSSVYNRVPDINYGGYMASYGRVSMSDTNNQDYLYRVEMPNHPHLNRMMTNMDMNHYDIVNAGVVVSDNMSVRNNVTIKGNASTGAVSPYVLAVGNNFSGSSMNVTSEGERKGELIVYGDADNNTFDFEIVNGLTMSGSGGAVVTTSAQVGTVTKMGEGVFETLNVNGGQFHAGDLVAVTTQVFGSVHTNFLQTAGANVGSINAPHAVVGVGNVTGTTTFNGETLSQSIEGKSAVSAGSVRATNVYAIENMSRCETGCPTLSTGEW